jgi:LysM repeat protein
VPKGFGLRVPTAKLKAQQADFLAAIPASFRLQAQSPDRYHKVQAGDALSVIARRYDTTVSELVAWNSLNDKHRIRIGQMLRLPQSGQSP